MGNSNGKQVSTGFSHRPHSVLGVRCDERFILHDKFNGSELLRQRYCENKSKVNHVSGKALLPPLPRSHSFHQILRPTENGVNLIKKGTIRGIDNSNGKYHSKEVPFSPQQSLNPELNAILRERRCKSEADLMEDEVEKDDSLDNISSSSPKSNGDAARKALGNGVAARIHRAKYQKGPAPLPPSVSPEASRSNHSRGHPHSDLSTTGFKSSEHIEKLSDLRNSRRGKDASSKEEQKTQAKPNISLIRRSSEKSYLSSKASDQDGEALPFRENFKMMLRCKPDSFKDLVREIDPVSRLESSEEMNRSTKNRYLLNEPSFNEINELISRELALRNQETEKSHKSGKINGEIGKERHDFRKEKAFEKQVSKIEQKPLHNEHLENRNNHYLPPVFDDNFILKRTTPTAGLFKNGKLNDVGSRKSDNHYHKKISGVDERSSKQFFPDIRLSGRYFNKGFNLNSYHWMAQDRPASPPLNSIVINPLNSLNSFFTQEVGPKARKFEQIKESPFCRSTSLRQLNHSSISDSANYSDEEEEEVIKVVLKPYLPPPPRRIPLEERIIIDDDLFNGDDTSAIKYGRQKCWTPMEDLSSSEEEDDDGINCDHGSEEEDALGKRDVRDIIHNYNTRFTLRNQLRTLIQNGKPRLHYS